ncbi:L,D-transpeptidase [Sporomusa silvacetica]|nr:L,D-transpeptidase family protein [Sporomusa silvacetica]
MGKQIIIFAIPYESGRNYIYLCKSYKLEKLGKRLTKEMTFAMVVIDERVCQVILVQPGDNEEKQGILTSWEKQKEKWKQIPSTIKVSLGRNGIISAAEKKEGDGYTPDGVYDIKRAFGYNTFITKLPYIHLTQNDYWVDDPASANYNRLVRQCPAVESCEKMKRDDNLYKIGFVIEYNTESRVSGQGSAIFAHIWRSCNSPTLGCVAMSEKDLAELLEWLNPLKNPVIIISQERMESFPMTQARLVGHLE